MVIVTMEDKQDEQPNDKKKCQATMKIFGSMSSMKKWYSVGEDSTSSGSSSGQNSTSAPSKITLKKLTPFDAQKTLRKIDTGQGNQSTLSHVQSPLKPPMFSPAESSLTIFDFDTALQSGMVTFEEIGNQKIYRCNICSLTCTGQKPIRDHLEGQKHKKSLKTFPSKVSAYLEAIDKARENETAVLKNKEGTTNDQTPDHLRKESENSIKEPVEPLDSQISDELGDKISTKLMGKVSILEAVPSIGKEKVTVASIPKLFVDIDTAQRIGIVSVDTDRKIYCCQVCNLTSHGPKPMIEHIEGQRHKKNLRSCPVKAQKFLDSLEYSSESELDSTENELKNVDASVSPHKEKKYIERSLSSVHKASSADRREVKEMEKEIDTKESKTNKEIVKEVFSMEESSPKLLKKPKECAPPKENITCTSEYDQTESKELKIPINAHGVLSDCDKDKKVPLEEESKESKSIGESVFSEAKDENSKEGYTVDTKSNIDTESSENILLDKVQNVENLSKEKEDNEQISKPLLKSEPSCDTQSKSDCLQISPEKENSNEVKENKHIETPTIPTESTEASKLPNQVSKALVSNLGKVKELGELSGMQILKEKEEIHLNTLSKVTEEESAKEATKTAFQAESTEPMRDETESIEKSQVELENNKSSTKVLKDCENKQLFSKICESVPKEKDDIASSSEGSAISASNSTMNIVKEPENSKATLKELKGTSEEKHATAVKPESTLDTEFLKKDDTTEIPKADLEIKSNSESSLEQKHCSSLNSSEDTTVKPVDSKQDKSPVALQVKTKNSVVLNNSERKKVKLVRTTKIEMIKISPEQSKTSEKLLPERQETDKILLENKEVRENTGNTTMELQKESLLNKVQEGNKGSEMETLIEGNKDVKQGGEEISKMRSESNDNNSAKNVEQAVASQTPSVEAVKSAEETKQLDTVEIQLERNDDSTEKKREVQIGTSEMQSEDNKDSSIEIMKPLDRSEMQSEVQEDTSIKKLEPLGTSDVQSEGDEDGSTENTEPLVTSEEKSESDKDSSTEKAVSLITSEVQLDANEKSSSNISETLSKSEQQEGEKDTSTKQPEHSVTPKEETGDEDSSIKKPVPSVTSEEQSKGKEDRSKNVLEPENTSQVHSEGGEDSTKEVEPIVKSEVKLKGNDESSAKKAETLVTSVVQSSDEESRTKKVDALITSQVQSEDDKGSSAHMLETLVTSEMKTESEENSSTELAEPLVASEIQSNGNEVSSKKVDPSFSSQMQSEEDEESSTKKAECLLSTEVQIEDDENSSTQETEPSDSTEVQLEKNNSSTTKVEPLITPEVQLESNENSSTMKVEPLVTSEVQSENEENNSTKKAEPLVTPELQSESNENNSKKKTENLVTPEVHLGDDDSSTKKVEPLVSPTVYSGDEDCSTKKLGPIVNTEVKLGDENSSMKKPEHLGTSELESEDNKESLTMKAQSLVTSEVQSEDNGDDSTKQSEVLIPSEVQSEGNGNSSAKKVEVLDTCEVQSKAMESLVTSEVQSEDNKDNTTTNVEPLVTSEVQSEDNKDNTTMNVEPLVMPKVISGGYEESSTIVDSLDTPKGLSEDHDDNSKKVEISVASELQSECNKDSSKKKAEHKVVSEIQAEVVEESTSKQLEQLAKPEMSLDDRDSSVEMERQVTPELQSENDKKNLTKLEHIVSPDMQPEHVDNSKDIVSPAKTNAELLDVAGTQENILENADTSAQCSKDALISKDEESVQKELESSGKLDDVEGAQKSSSNNKLSRKKDNDIDCSKLQEVENNEAENLAKDVLDSDLAEKSVQSMDQSVLSTIESEKVLKTTASVDEILDSTTALSEPPQQSSPASDEISTPKKRAGRPPKSSISPQVAEYQEVTPKKRTVRRSSSSHNLSADDNENSPEKLGDSASKRRSGRTHKPTEKLKDFICTKGIQSNLLGTGNVVKEILQTKALESNEVEKQNVKNMKEESIERSNETKEKVMDEKVEIKKDEENDDKSSKEEVDEPPVKRRRGRPPKASSPTKVSSPTKLSTSTKDSNPTNVSSPTKESNSSKNASHTSEKEEISPTELTTKVTRTRRGRKPKLESSEISDDSKPKTDDKDEKVEITPIGRKRRSVKSVVEESIQDNDETSAAKSPCDRPKAVKRRGRPPKNTVACPETNEESATQEQVEMNPKAEEKSKSQEMTKVQEKPKSEEKPIKDTIQKIVRSKNATEKPIKDAIKNIVRSKACEEKAEKSIKDAVKTIDQTKTCEEKIEKAVEEKPIKDAIKSIVLSKSCEGKSEKIMEEKPIKDAIKNIVLSKSCEEKPKKVKQKKTVQQEEPKEKTMKNTIKRIFQSKASNKRTPTPVKEQGKVEEEQTIPDVKVEEQTTPVVTPKSEYYEPSAWFEEENRTPKIEMGKNKNIVVEDGNKDVQVPEGWQRKVQMRANGKTAGVFDVYYYGPTGKHLRSRSLLEKYCEKEGIEIDYSIFKFTHQASDIEKALLFRKAGLDEQADLIEAKYTQKGPFRTALHSVDISDSTEIKSEVSDNVVDPSSPSTSVASTVTHIIPPSSKAKATTSNVLLSSTAMVPASMPGSAPAQTPAPAEEPVKKTKRAQLYTPEQRAEMARLCMEMGPTKSAREMSKKLNRHVSESTMRSVKKAWERQNPGVLQMMQGNKPTPSTEMKGEVKRSSPYCQEPPKYLSTIISSLKEEDIIRLKNHISKKGSQYSSKFLEALSAIKLPSDEKKKEESTLPRSSHVDGPKDQHVGESVGNTGGDSSSSDSSSSDDSSSSSSSSDDDSSSGDSSSDESSSSDDEDAKDEKSLDTSPKLPSPKLPQQKLPSQKLPAKQLKEKTNIVSENVVEKQDLSQLVKPLEEDSDKEDVGDSSGGSSSSDSSSDDSSSDSSSGDSSGDSSSDEDSDDEEKENKQKKEYIIGDTENMDVSLPEMDHDEVVCATEERPDLIDLTSSLPTPPIGEDNDDDNIDNCDEDDSDDDDDDSDSDSDDAENNINSDEEDNENIREHNASESSLAPSNEVLLTDENKDRSDSGETLDSVNTFAQHNQETRIEDIATSANNNQKTDLHSSIKSKANIYDSSCVVDINEKESKDIEGDCIANKKVESKVDAASSQVIKESTSSSIDSSAEVVESSVSEAKSIFNDRDNSTSFFPTPPSEDSQEFAFSKSTSEAGQPETVVESTQEESDKSQKQLLKERQNENNDMDSAPKGCETLDQDPSKSDSLQTAVILPTSSLEDSNESNTEVEKLGQCVKDIDGCKDTESGETAINKRKRECQTTQDTSDSVDTSEELKLGTEICEVATIEEERKSEESKLNECNSDKTEKETGSIIKETSSEDIAIITSLKPAKKKTKCTSDVMKDIWKSGKKRRNKNNSPKKDNVSDLVESSVKKLTAKTEQKEESYKFEAFNWKKYLAESKNIAAPVECFKQHLSPPENKFEVGMKLESVDPRNVSSTCIATVKMTSGPSINLQLDGEDSMNSFWKLVDCQDIHPIGHCEANNGIIVPPFGFTRDISSWTRFLKRSLKDAVHAPPEAFQKEPPTPSGNLFKSGMMLEVIDRKNTDYICAASVGAIEGDNIQIVCDVWYGSFDYWCRYDSREIFPVGWCGKIGITLQLPQNLYVDDDDHKSKDKGKSTKKAKDTENIPTKDPPPSPKKVKKSKQVSAAAKTSLAPQNKEPEKAVSLTRSSKRITVQVVTDVPCVVALGSAGNEIEGIDFKRRKNKDNNKGLVKSEEADGASVAKKGKRKSRGGKEEQSVIETSTAAETDEKNTAMDVHQEEIEDKDSPCKKKKNSAHEVTDEVKECIETTAEIKEHKENTKELSASTRTQNIDGETLAKCIDKTEPAVSSNEPNVKNEAENVVNIPSKGLRPSRPPARRKKVNQQEQQIQQENPKPELNKEQQVQQEDPKKEEDKEEQKQQENLQQELNKEQQKHEHEKQQNDQNKLNQSLDKPQQLEKTSDIVENNAETTKTEAKIHSDVNKDESLDPDEEELRRALEPFDWEGYLKEIKCIAAPSECFKQPLKPPDNNFEVGMKLESVDPRNTSSTCIATVMMKSGPSINLQLDGEDSMNNFWRLVDSKDIHPIGHCESGDGILVPPFGFTKGISSWLRFRKKTLAGAKYAPAEIFHEEPPSPPKNMFKKGMMLEAVDRKSTDYICVAKIGDVTGDLIQVVGDVWYGKFDYWCRYDSREIFPTGWCATTRQVLQVPTKFYTMSSASSSSTNQAAVNKTPVKSSSVSQAPVIKSPVKSSINQAATNTSPVKSSINQAPEIKTPVVIQEVAVNSSQEIHEKVIVGKKNNEIKVEAIVERINDGSSKADNMHNVEVSPKSKKEKKGKREWKDNTNEGEGMSLKASEIKEELSPNVAKKQKIENTQEINENKIIEDTKAYITETSMEKHKNFSTKVEPEYSLKSMLSEYAQTKNKVQEKDECKIGKQILKMPQVAEQETKPFIGGLPQSSVGLSGKPKKRKSWGITTHDKIKSANYTLETMLNEYHDINDSGKKQKLVQSMDEESRKLDRYKMELAHQSTSTAIERKDSYELQQQLEKEEKLRGRLKMINDTMKVHKYRFEEFSEESRKKLKTRRDSDEKTKKKKKYEKEINKELAKKINLELPPTFLENKNKFDEEISSSSDSSIDADDYKHVKKKIKKKQKMEQSWARNEMFRKNNQKLSSGKDFDMESNVIVGNKMVVEPIRLELSWSIAGHEQEQQACERLSASESCGENESPSGPGYNSNSSSRSQSSSRSSSSSSNSSQESDCESKDEHFKRKKRKKKHKHSHNSLSETSESVSATDSQIHRPSKYNEAGEEKKRKRKNLPEFTMKNSAPPHLCQDLPVGWKRVFSRRRKGGWSGKQDIYYYSPQGWRLRSCAEIQQYCQQRGMSVDISLFNFSFIEEEHGSNEDEQIDTTTAVPINMVNQVTTEQYPVGELSDQKITLDIEGLLSIELPKDELGKAQEPLMPGMPGVTEIIDEVPELPYGWKRGYAYRGGAPLPGKLDVYYYSPTKKRLRSKNEVRNYCEARGIKIDLDLFQFSALVESSDEHSEKIGAADNASNLFNQNQTATDTHQEINYSEYPEGSVSSRLSAPTSVKKEPGNESSIPPISYSSSSHKSDNDQLSGENVPCIKKELILDKELYSSAVCSKECQIGAHIEGCLAFLIQQPNPKTGACPERIVTELSNGWFRVITYRKGAGRHGRRDIHYYSPRGKKLRSVNEIKKWCEEKGVEVDYNVFKMSPKDDPCPPHVYKNLHQSDEAEACPEKKIPIAEKKIPVTKKKIPVLEKMPETTEQLPKRRACTLAQKKMAEALESQKKLSESQKKESVSTKSKTTRTPNPNPSALMPIFVARSQIKASKSSSSSVSSVSASVETDHGTKFEPSDASQGSSYNEDYSHTYVNEGDDFSAEVLESSSCEAYLDSVNYLYDTESQGGAVAVELELDDAEVISATTGTPGILPPLYDVADVDFYLAGAPTGPTAVDTTQVPEPVLAVTPADVSYNLSSANNLVYWDETITPSQQIKQMFVTEFDSPFTEPQPEPILSTSDCLVSGPSHGPSQPSAVPVQDLTSQPQENPVHHSDAYLKFIESQKQNTTATTLTTLQPLTNLQPLTTLTALQPVSLSSDYVEQHFPIT